jgi:outer membrane protein assembly factor BamB
MNTRTSFAGISALLLVLAARAADWPQFLGPHRNGVCDETGYSFRWPAAGPPRLWSYAVGAGWSGPVVVGDRVLIHHRVEDSACLDCLQVANGKRVWRYEEPTSYQDSFRFDEGPRATPAVAEGRVFIFGADGLLRAIDLATGKRLWGHDLHTEYRVPQGFFGAACSPLVEGGRVILNVGGRGAGVVAFDAATGKEAWKATDDAASYSSPVAATVNGVRSIFVFTRDGLVALDPADGKVRFKERWRSRNQASVNAATPMIVNDQVFVSSSYQTGAVVWKIRGDGLTPLWKSDDVLSNHYNTSVYRDGFLYGIEGRQEYGAHLRCVDWATGKPRWTKERFGCATLVLVEGNVLALTEHGDLVAFAASPEAYREIGRAKVLNDPIRAAFALSGGRVYARDGKQLIALDVK